MQTFDPTTNRIPFGLLTPEEQKTLKEWPHGWEFHLEGDWGDITTKPAWIEHFVYRGKPAPIVQHTYISVYKSGRTGLPWKTVEQLKANSAGKPIAVIHIETVGDKFSVTVLD